MILRSLLSFILSLALMPQVQGGAEQITMSKKIDKEQRNTLRRDLENLKNFNFGQSGEVETLQIMGIDDVNSTTLLDWLTERVSVVIEDTDIPNLKIKSESFNRYPRNNDPIIEKARPAPRTGSGSKGVTVMSNIGTGLYYAGKTTSKLFTLKVRTGFLSSKSFEIKSPRTGVIQIGEGLFMKKYLMNKENEAALANSLGRMAIFFHEARHSDGHGETLGFFHAVCPNDHDFAGVYACDRNTNGPYTIGAQVIKEFIKNCDDCSVSEKEQMRLRYLDSLNRVLSTTTKVIDNDDTEVKILKMRLDTKISLYDIEVLIGGATLKTYKEILQLEKELIQAAIKADAVELIPSKFWNAAPESI